MVLNASTTTVEHGEGFFSGVDGVLIHHRSWWPSQDPVARVTLVHGFAEHSGRYEHLARRLVAAGYAVSGLDHRGHGRSGGPRTNVARFSDYVDDLKTFVDAGAQRWPQAPGIMLGHSMGGLIALAFAVSHGEELRALAVSAPAACPGDVSRFKIATGRVLSRVAPAAPVLRLPLQRISRDPAVVDAYEHDPLVFRTPIKARLGAEMLDTMAHVEASLPELRMPLLVMQGTRDGLVDPGCGPHVYERAGSPDKTLKMYEGLWHEIFNEPERDLVINDLISWLDTHRA